MSFLHFSFGIILTFLLGPVLSIPTVSNLVTNLNNTNAAGFLDTGELATGKVSCSTRYYGKDLDYESCMNAWRKIPRSPAQDSYGTRGQRVQIRLPIRYQSSDGRCVIDIRPARLGAAIKLDLARGVDISDAARNLMQTCVIKKQGGSVRDFSQYKLLALTISKYESKASCNLSPLRIPSVASCEIALGQMPAGPQLLQFIGQQDTPTETAYTKLPRAYIHENHSGQICEVQVSRLPESGSSDSKWSDIWAAGVDIWTMCVQNGMSGVVRNLGDNNQLQIEISDGPISDTQ